MVLSPDLKESYCSMDKTAVVILHYKDEENTRKCLDSLQKEYFRDSSFKIIVVCNELCNNFCLTLPRYYPQIHIVENKKNLGFAEGNNVGIRKALNFGCEYIVLLNNDTVVGPDLIKKLVSFAKSNISIGLLSPKIYFAPGFEFHKNRYKEKDKGKVLWYGGGIIDWKNIYATHRGVDEVDKKQYDKGQETDFVTGCCMLIKKCVVDKIGFFDSKYFLYYEDVDYSIRTVRQGLKVVYYPKAHLWHKNASASGSPGSPLHVYYQTRNRLYFGYKYASLMTKKSLFFESLRMIMKDGIQRKACFDYYLGRMGKANI